MMLIGIDLGTNNTVLSYYENGHLHVIQKAIPSIVSVEDNIITIGEDALSKNHHKNLKRNLTTNSKVLYLYQSFLTKIKEIIENITQEYQVIVTVPAYFSEIEKDITKRAVIGAGLPLLRLLAEPTAAGIAYGHFHHTLDEVILVFDMGAGTTDLTLMRKSLDDDNQNNFYEVINIMGDVKFGGLDITELLRKILPSNINPEEAKIKLSSGDIPELSQKKYFSILEENYLEKINSLFDTILKDGSMNKKEVDNIIFVGGSTKNPYIRRTVSNYFQKDLDFLLDPDTAVSFGASIYGNSLQSKDSTVVLIDRLPMSIGIEVDDGKYAVLIEKNTIVPTKRESYFTTQEDNQEYIDVKIYQGEHKYVKDNCLMGLFNVKLEELKPKALIKINVTAEINPDGVLIVTAKDPYKKNKHNSLEIKTSRNNNIEKYITILPHELYEEEYELLNKIYANLKQQILFQLEENIYLNIDLTIKNNQLKLFYEKDSIITKLLLVIEATKDIDILQENIIEIKKIIKFIQQEFSEYLKNYNIEDTQSDNKSSNYLSKIEEFISNINTYKLSEIDENKIIELFEEIIKLDNKECELLYIQVSEILGFNFLN
jgi:molecular chaperone DnaK (HSP70)